MKTMKNLINPLLIATALITTACTNTTDIDNHDVDPSGKTPISFSVEENLSTRTRAGFSDETKIAMRIKSERTVNNNKETRYTRTVANAAAAATGKEFSAITIEGTDIRYWDDAFGRDANLSVYAIAVPNFTPTDLENTLTGGTASTMIGTTPWFTEENENETLFWSVTTSAQTKDLIDAEDLTYSNNIQDGGYDGVYRYDFDKSKYPDYSTDLVDGCMKFSQKSGAASSDPGKFDKGHLIFNHALSRITVNLIKGDGFTSTDPNVVIPFEFATGTNVKVLGVPVSGTLKLTDGSWSNVSTDDIDLMAPLTPEGSVTYSLMAQMLPGYEISKTGTKTSMLEFIIDDNNYSVTQAQVYDALYNATNKEKMQELKDDKVTMEQGLNYTFNIKVKKTAVSVTASVASFTPITAQTQEPSNARITLSGIYDNNGTASTGFSLYRLKDESDIITDNYEGKKWDGDYTDVVTVGDNTLTPNTDGSWNTAWFFESNKTYYHFRTVRGGTVVTTDDKDYFVVNSCATSVDPRWGAPMTAAPQYDTKDGYAAMVSPAIGPSTDKINLTDMHVMSNVIVKLQTTDGNDKVKLEGAEVYVTRLYNEGQVRMGDGLVTPSGNLGSQKMDGNTAGTEFSFSFVPQSLVRGDNPTADDYVGLKIVTGDGNQYFIAKLSDIVKLSDATSHINFWYPNHEYTYTFTLKKSGIDKVTCSVQKWISVTAKEQNISLE